MTSAAKESYADEEKSVREQGSFKSAGFCNYGSWEISEGTKCKLESQGSSCMAPFKSKDLRTTEMNGVTRSKNGVPGALGYHQHTSSAQRLKNLQF